LRPLAFKGDLHFDTVAVVGSDEVGADQKQDDMSRAHVSIDLVTPFLTSANAAVVPTDNQTVSSQQRKLLLEFVAQLLVFVGVRVKDFKRHMLSVKPMRSGGRRADIKSP
jgi:hypothetical protein